MKILHSSLCNPPVCRAGTGRQSAILSRNNLGLCPLVVRGRPSRSHPASSQKGFTLIELLVSLVILALLSVAGYRSLDAVIQTRERVATETHKWQHLTFFFARVEQDIAQAVHRSVRDSSGLSRPEWIGHAVVVGEDDAELTFTRAGIPDQGITMQSPLRIAYRLEQGNIVMLRWPALDQAERMRPIRYPLLEGVREFKWRYLDTSGYWLTQWPTADNTGGLPQAAEVSLTLISGDKFTRIFALQ